MIYLCVNCNYLYDESLGDLDEGIEPGTTIEEMIGNYNCPNCDGSMDDFQIIEEEILYAENSENKAVFESKHIPSIKFLENGKIMTTVGDVKHPMEKEHLITSIMLYDGYGELIEEEFLTHGQEPTIEFDISDLDEFEVRARCNLHGLWSTGILENNL